MYDEIIKNVAGDTQYVIGTAANELFLVAGSSSDYGFEAIEDGGFVIWNHTTGSHDILYNVEGLQFDDVAFTFDGSSFTSAEMVDVSGGDQGGNGGDEGQPATAEDDTFDFTPGETVTIDVLANDDNAHSITQINGVDMQAGWTTWVDGVGLVTVNDDYTLTVEPYGDGPISFEYTTACTDGSTSTATVSGTPDGGGGSQNTDPNAVADSGTGILGETITVDVLANDSDADGDSLEITAVNDLDLFAGWAQYVDGVGVVYNNGDGTLSFDLDPGVTEADVEYTISDSNGGTDWANVHVSTEEPDRDPIKAEIVGNGTIMEGASGWYKIQLDQAVEEDTLFTLQVHDGSANRVDRNDHEVANQDIMWGGYYDTRYGIGGEIAQIYHDKIANGTSVSLGNRDTVGPDGKPVWDYTVFDDGHVAQGGTVQVLVKAGETMSDTFDVKAWKEKLTVDNDSDFTKANPHFQEGTENFKIKIVDSQTSGDDEFMNGGPKSVHIQDKGDYHSFSPVTLDLNDDGEIGVTGESSSYQKDADAELGRTVEFDIDADGDLDTIEWLDGSGDGMLVDLSKVGADGSIDGSALFGDEGGKYANGYAKLELLDVDGDGQLTGAEMGNLGLWVDDGDAILEAGEMQTVADAGVAAISTTMEIVMDGEGRELMQSSATMTDGSTIMSEDVWFDGTASEEMTAEVAEQRLEEVECEDCF